MAREGSPTDTGLYKAIEKHLRQAKTALTCVDLYDRPDVRAKAIDANQVSDALGHLWRRDFVKRRPAPKTPHNQARWAYYWPDDITVVSPQPAARPVMEREVVSESSRVVLSKPKMTIVDDG